jgi:ribonuclease HII
MSVVAGIDEAGFGPLLGPLVVTAAGVTLPDRQIDSDMWKLLSPAAAQKPSRRSQAVVIADSKKVFQRSGDNPLAPLERGVLVMLAARGVRPASLRELLRAVAPRALEQMDRYPWYAGADLPLPHRADATDIALTGNALAAAMSKAGMTLSALRSEVIFVGEYNRIVEATRNKSVTLFDINSRLLYYLWPKLWPDGNGLARIYADRLGGRMRYLTPLQRVLENCSFTVLEETETLSGYRICDGPRTAELFYGVEFDQRHLPVAFASMVCKYLRELFMELINAWWARHVPGLAPTAGYYTDGKRFLQQIAPAVARLGVDM